MPAKKKAIAVKPTPAKKTVRKKATKKIAKKATKKVAKKATKKVAKKAESTPTQESKLSTSGVCFDARRLMAKDKHTVKEAVELLAPSYPDSTSDQLKRVCWVVADKERRSKGLALAVTWKASKRGPAAK